MNCPDWRHLVAARERCAGEDPAGWREALEHLETCPQCRRDALEVDPLLAFRGLPEPALEADEGRRMVAATRALRRRQTAAARWRRRAAAAVAVVTVVAALAVSAGVLERAEGPTRAASTEPSEDLVAPTNLAAAALEAASREPAPAATPSVLALEQSTARVYEVTDADLAVIVVVDDELDLGGRG